MEILLIEDEKLSQKLLFEVLVSMGHKVTSANDGKQAWSLFQKREYNLIITDFVMPNMNGIELCKKIRSNISDLYTYIIFLTSMKDKEKLLEIFNAGADDYLSKPVDIEELKARIKTGERIINLEVNFHSIKNTLIESRNKLTIKNKELEETLEQLKFTQAQIIQSEKMASIGQLAAGVAHEINNPTGFVSSNITTLRGYHRDIFDLINCFKKLMTELKNPDLSNQVPVDILKRVGKIHQMESDIDLEYIQEDIFELVDDCKEGLDRIKKIVIDLKDFAHPGEDKIRMTNINRCLESTLNVVHNELKYKASIVKNFGEIPDIQCYPQQINQVFMNILVNAAQAIEEKGEIKIITNLIDEYIEIIISDTGKGIPESIVSKIYDPFFTTKDVGEGTGLGLHIVYNIIKKHNGRIDVESKLGEGSKFIIRIPAEYMQ